MTSRRDFLTLAGLSVLGLARKSSPQKPEFAVQLYSVRDYIRSESDLGPVLGRVAELGYSNVETAFWPADVTLEQATQALKAAGLEVIAAHVELPFGAHRDSFLRIADAYRCTRMVWHGWPEDPRYATADGVRKLCDLYNEAHAWAVTQGLTLYLHNHWWEFEALPDGRLPFYVLLEELDSGIMFEIDIWWTLVAGQNPAEVVKAFGSRASLLHIKDGAVLGQDGPMVAVGQGVQDLGAVFENSADVRYAIVELDRVDGDMFESLDQSRKFILEHGWVR